MRFMDTMSMHTALRGMTGDQRMLYMARTKGSMRKEVREYQERAAKYREEMVHMFNSTQSKLFIVVALSLMMIICGVEKLYLYPKMGGSFRQMAYNYKEKFVTPKTAKSYF